MEVTASRRKLYLAFIALAFLAGPIDQSISSAFLVGSPLPAFHSLTIASLLAAAVLGIFAAARRAGLPNQAESLALLVLIVPQWLFVLFGPNTTSFAALHLGWGTALLFSLAATLWLGLLSTTDLIDLEVPRAAVAAAIIGIGAICLSLPVDATGVTLRQVPAMLLNVLLGLMIVGSWIFARPRLIDCPIPSAAAVYLALSAFGYAVFALIYERDSWRASDVHVSWITVLPEIAVLIVSWCLWFWLLQKLSLAAFSMRMLANCAAALLPGFLSFGVGQWRMDVSFVISCIAVAVALRATPAEEQLQSLGLEHS